MEQKKIGYKGFDKDLKCINFQYEVGKTYAIEKKDLKICSKGFHFCWELENVNGYYSFPLEQKPDSNRYCEVEILGDVIDGGDKSVTDILRIIRELTPQEVIQIRNKRYWDAAWELQQRYPQYLIGGSMALMMLGLMEKDSRVFHDLDMTAPHYVVLNDPDFVPTHHGGGRYGSVSAHATYKNVPIDFFVAPMEKPKRITFEEKQWNITDVSTILKAKIDYIFNAGEVISESKKKHKKDMLDIFMGLNKKHTFDSKPGFDLTDMISTIHP
jgi:hypothetical protein